MATSDVEMMEHQADPATQFESCTRPIAGVVTGVLIGFADDGRTPLVLFQGQPGQAALRAACTVDLQGQHIGRQVALMFEHGEPRRPVVIGLLRGAGEWPLAGPPGHVEVDSDGERLIVSARQQLVLKCGKASITLTKAGKVLIRGTYVSNRSSGVVSIAGGAVKIN
jgi:hypothetical protein